MLCKNIFLIYFFEFLAYDFFVRTELGPWTLIAGDALLQADGKENENIDVTRMQLTSHRSFFFHSFFFRSIYACFLSVHGI